ncbi:MAG TPA: hypothetical protein VFY65_00320, partial [Longimicrobium sp.]|nr:hypothetical protein [Longimicrobium sp.]
PITASDALLVLVRALPPERRPSASGGVIASLREHHAAAGIELPPDVLAAAGTPAGTPAST